ncbi:hypothetical protein OH76DRAFT_1485174 [Lentinus brumalis]|uniref:Uncharacterized protein n=1 Tax=Lentinus brumalis TaxID=2498619 RepID=A0A371D319_9APHY|nr:hypothetical protein OH76DRAFT_1485174 [Polyporus brumalis]
MSVQKNYVIICILTVLLLRFVDVFLEATFWASPSERPARSGLWAAIMLLVQAILLQTAVHLGEDVVTEEGDIHTELAVLWTLTPLISFSPWMRTWLALPVECTIRAVVMPAAIQYLRTGGLSTTGLYGELIRFDLVYYYTEFVTGMLRWLEWFIEAWDTAGESLRKFRIVLRRSRDESLRLAWRSRPKARLSGRHPFVETIKKLAQQAKVELEG